MQISFLPIGVIKALKFYLSILKGCHFLSHLSDFQGPGNVFSFYLNFQYQPSKITKMRMTMANLDENIP